jgi:adenylate cyclase
MTAPLRVLVVDDEPPNLETFRRVYRKLYEISVATSGAIGLELLAKSKFDVVLSDFSMPGMSGAEFVSKAQESQPIAVVMLTGHICHPEVVELETSGAIFAVVGKPWQKESMIEVVARASECTRSLRGECTT